MPASRHRAQEAVMRTLRTRASIGLIVILALPASLSFAKDSDDEQRLQKAATVLSEIINILTTC
jgi:hypothetical protein